MSDLNTFQTSNPFSHIPAHLGGQQSQLCCTNYNECKEPRDMPQWASYFLCAATRDRNQKPIQHPHPPPFLPSRPIPFPL
ncbi:hypothetical protein VTH06DRAFT_2648 [Thermothelomyces fergusii]